MANLRQFDLDDISIRPGTYFNPQTEVLIVVDDSPVDTVVFNIEDFKLRSFFGREVSRLRKRLAMGAFSFVGIQTGDVMVGLAAVRLGYAAHVFGYIYDFGTGKLYERSARTLVGQPLPDSCARKQSQRDLTSGLSLSFLEWMSERGARVARREERAYREYSSDEQRRQSGCPARKPHDNYRVHSTRSARRRCTRPRARARTRARERSA